MVVGDEVDDGKGSGVGLRRVRLTLSSFFFRIPLLPCLSFYITFLSEVSALSPGDGGADILRGFLGKSSGWRAEVTFFILFLASIADSHPSVCRLVPLSAY